jgi:hypothetical protein
MGLIAGELTPFAHAAKWYAAPNGSPSGNGSINSPWDIKTALSSGKGVQPGDTIYLRGGTYNVCSTFAADPYNPYCIASTVAGSSGAPVTIRSAPGEWAVLDGVGPVLTSTGAIIMAKGTYVWYMDFEIKNSNATTRQTNQTGSFISNVDGWAIDVLTSHLKFIDLVIQNVGGGGIGTFNSYDDIESYGNIIYYIGWQGPDRGHGHAIYQNSATNVRVRSNIMFEQFDIGLQLYGGPLPNYDVEGNTAFYNGTLAYSGATIDLLLGDDSGNVATSPIFLNNRTYSPMSQGADTTNIGFFSGCTNLTHNNNYYVAPTPLKLVNCTVSSMTGNTFYGATSGFSPSSYPGNTSYSSRPSGVQVFVQPNSYEAGRGYITVYNWAGQSSVSVDVSSVLAAGDTYEVLDAQYYHGAPVASGTYSGGSIAIPVPGASSPIDPAIGNVSVQPVHTPNEFGVFVLLKTGTSSSGGSSSGGSGASTPGPLTVSVSPSSLNFGQVAVGSVSSVQTVTVTNAGSSSVTLNAAAITGSSTFALAGPGTCPTGSLAPGASCNYGIQFSPTSATAEAATLDINDNAAGNPQLVSLNGTGTSGASGGGDYSSGLVAEWKLLGNAIESANGDNGALHTGAGWANSTYSGASFSSLSLNGSSGYMSANEEVQLEMTKQLSVSFWMYVDPTPQSGVDPRVVNKVYDWYVKLNGNMYPQFSANNMYAMASYAVPLHTWTHVVFTFNSGAVQAYVNGQPVSFAANTFASGTVLPNNNYGLYLGADSSLGNFFSGNLSDVRIYNRVLSPVDVQALLSAVTPATLQSSPVAPATVTSSSQ